jgi:photosystem II stability/assembly factor-like uncharacterized protein
LTALLSVCIPLTSRLQNPKPYTPRPWLSGSPVPRITGPFDERLKNYLTRDDQYQSQVLMKRHRMRRSLAPVLAAAVLTLLPAAMPLSAADVQVDILDSGQSSGITFYGMCWKRDGSQALIVGDDSTVLTYGHSGGKFKRIDDTRLPAFLFSAAWRPDSLYALVVGADGAVFNFNGQTLTPYCSSRANYLRSVDWKSDSSEALMVGTGGTILRFQDGIFKPVASPTTVDLFSCSWNPKTGTALISGANSTLLELETNGSVSAIPFVEDWSLYAVSWNPDGDKALITGANGNIAVYDGASIFTIHNGTPDNFLGCCWKPGSDSAFLCGDAGSIIEYSAGKLTMINSGLQSQLYSIRFRPQGDYALSIGYFAKVARYPKVPGPVGTCLFENPLVIAGMLLILAGVLIAYYAKDRLDRRSSPSAPKGSRRQRLKERRTK